MTDTLNLILAALAGIALGVVFFGGLWLTVQRALASPRPALWFLGSLVLRTAVALAGFYLVGQGHWDRLLACLVGFLAGRVVVAWLTRPAFLSASEVVAGVGTPTPAGGQLPCTTGVGVPTRTDPGHDSQ